MSLFVTQKSHGQDALIIAAGESRAESWSRQGARERPCCATTYHMDVICIYLEYHNSVQLTGGKPRGGVTEQTTSRPSEKFLGDAKAVTGCHC